MFMSGDQDEETDFKLLHGTWESSIEHDPLILRIKRLCDLKSIIRFRVLWQKVDRCLLRLYLLWCTWKLWDRLLQFLYLAYFSILLYNVIGANNIISKVVVTEHTTLESQIHTPRDDPANSECSFKTAASSHHNIVSSKRSVKSSSQIRSTNLFYDRNIDGSGTHRRRRRYKEEKLVWKVKPVDEEKNNEKKEEKKGKKEENKGKKKDELKGKK
ncbi:hypothetical protein L6452_27480 [Arctium lappa]|uniref:Uncharacterized protein n=1 Tax=Arctium lappa TaxID=4217 RepID=A0ACB8ZWC2_ARCLA|nr:hypothetical protein L6452_27480 [Arctium lappa]